ncbi:MAG: putative tRNA-dihydrouridine synthase [candidate division WS2 bacterium ADurb.Bin280]|uniref:Putative tRNA-dihydrouridine synthase n=1 Tax=candidate division WS2 bacterium ADurb.Bin280 TaxID=1852829 RepID=A0A1V5SFC2_9BACT|nr:MAG: putative tRNA-dihydrouridine synthase [candidate division WS2 bacterium ADurb.Bin280]
MDWFEKIKKPIIALAPMHGYTYSEFRQKCAKAGADAVYSEMVASEAIIRDVPQAMEMLGFEQNERPVILQIFGSNSEVMAKAAQIIEERFSPDGIDINFGCPVQKAAKQGFGSCQLADDSEAAKIVKAVCSATSIAVSVKMRLVSFDANENIDFIKKMHQAGARLFSVHGRIRTQKYRGHADWNLLRKIKQGCGDIPILGSGDVDSLQFLKDNLGNLDGALVGRAAKRDPEIFGELVKIKND